MSDELKKQSFDPHLNTTFKVLTEAHGLLETQLVEIKDHSNDDMETFTLLFKVPKEKFFDQKTYKIEHEKMGDIELFLTPVVSKDQDALYYESVFNRLKK